MIMKRLGAEEQRVLAHMNNAVGGVYDFTGSPNAKRALERLAGWSCCEHVDGNKWRITQLGRDCLAKGERP